MSAKPTRRSPYDRLAGVGWDLEGASTAVAVYQYLLRQLARLLAVLPTESRPALDDRRKALHRAVTARLRAHDPHSDDDAHTGAATQHPELPDPEEGRGA